MLPVSERGYSISQVYGYFITRPQAFRLANGRLYRKYVATALPARRNAFAQDKPITLINGSELLHLLEENGYKFRIDLEEARALMKKMVHRVIERRERRTIEQKEGAEVCGFKLL